MNEDIRVDAPAEAFDPGATGLRETVPDTRRTGTMSDAGSTSRELILHQMRASKEHTNTVLTTLAAVFNVLAILVICFLLMPRVNEASEQSQRAANEVGRATKAAEHNHQLLEENRQNMLAARQELREFAKTIKRLGDAMDVNEARMKALKEKRGGQQ